MSIVIIMVLVNAINVPAQSQKETNKTDIGDNQKISGRISGLSKIFNSVARVVDKSPK